MEIVELIICTLAIAIGLFFLFLLFKSEKDFNDKENKRRERLTSALEQISKDLSNK